MNMNKAPVKIACQERLNGTFEFDISAGISSSGGITMAFLDWESLAVSLMQGWEISDSERAMGDGGSIFKVSHPDLRISAEGRSQYSLP